MNVLAMLLVAVSFIAPPDPKGLEGLDAVIERALVDQKIPGVSVGVVVGDEVVLLKGYGLRDVEAGAPMTPDTKQQIASVTKQFTVAALGTLVRQGKLEWEKPVRDYLPDFRLHDDYATLHATPKDLVTHRIGLPRHDFVWFGSTLDREEFYGRLRYLPFNKDIRTTFQYNNFMFMTAGYLGGRIAGSDWETLVRTSLFQPLSMNRSGFSLAEVAADADAAKGYKLDNDRRIVRDEFVSVEGMGPTGTITSTARDMTAHLRMMLAGGEFGGQRVLQESDVRMMMQPVTPIGPSPFPEIGFRSYGMGLFIETYRGIEIAHHGGNMPGAAATVMFAPKERIGIVVLTNRSASRLRDGLPYEILDRLLGLPSAKMVDRFAEVERKTLAGEEAALAAGVSDRKPNTTPGHALDDYAGTYTEPAYGTLEIARDGDRLRVTIHGFTAPLDHWHYEVFQTPRDKTSRLNQSRVQFITDLAGEVSAVSVPLEPNTDPILFTRKPPAELLDPINLKRFTGRYELNGIEVTIQVREDGVLQLVQLGQARDLVPVGGMTFRVKGQNNASIEFLTAADGTIDRFASHAGGSTIATRKK